MPRFAIGEMVALKGLLGEIHGGAPGKVVSVMEHKKGIAALDEYEVVFENSTQLLLCSFQLTHVCTAEAAEQSGKLLMQEFVDI